MSEKISSLFDNEVDNNNIDKEIGYLSSKKSNKKIWSSYQVIRDVLHNNFNVEKNISDKIMEAIDKEPTQMSGYIDDNTDKNNIDSLKHWKIAASFAALFFVGIASINLTFNHEDKPIQLVREDISAEIIAQHYANTSLNAGHFIQANFSRQD
jgi:sigma-E factor negative regulatory protein RseA